MHGRPTSRAVWKPISGFESLYEVCDEGFVRSLDSLRQHGGYRPRHLKGRVLKGRHAPSSYPSVTLHKDGVPKPFDKAIHVLVAEAFCANPAQAPFVLHRDDNKTNNRASNLYWGTRARNVQDAINNGKIKPRKLTDDQVREIRKLCISESHRLYKRSGGGLDTWLARQFGVSVTLIGEIRTMQGRRYVSL